MPVELASSSQVPRAEPASRMYRLLVWGERACFPRPECIDELVTYDVMPPFTARGILESVHWRPDIQWVIRRIELLRPTVPVGTGEHESIETISTPGAGRVVCLRDVAYVIHADLVVVRAGDPGRPPVPHAFMFRNRARKGRFYRQPYFGIRHCPAQIRLVEGDEALSQNRHQTGSRDFGWVAFDAVKSRTGSFRYFRAIAHDGVVEVPPPDSPLIFS